MKKTELLYNYFINYILNAVAYILTWQITLSSDY